MLVAPLFPILSLYVTSIKFLSFFFFPSNASSLRFLLFIPFVVYAAQRKSFFLIIFVGCDTVFVYKGFTNGNAKSDSPLQRG